VSGVVTVSGVETVSVVFVFSPSPPQAPSKNNPAVMKRSVLEFNILPPKLLYCFDESNVENGGY